jgi:hypothetical protein
MTLHERAAALRGALRRRLIPFLCLLGLVAISNPLPPAAVFAANPIVTENQQPGTPGWQIGGLVADDATGQIKGYASATSVSQNQSLNFYVTVNPPQNFNMDFYRIGWYGGVGARQRLHVGALSGVHQSACLPDTSTGLIACTWTPSYTLMVPIDWTSGVYIAVLTNAFGYQNYIIFVVKDGRPAPLLYQQSVTTYQAYNNYPDDHATGKSLYGYNSYGAPTVSGSFQAVKVSFDRPYTSDGSGHFFFWEVQFIRWIERTGFDVTYSTDIDTHENGAALRNSKGFLAVGHDEYWSKGMRDNVEAARDAGVSLGFFTSNAVYWQVRFEPSAAGVADRVMVCFKDATTDPVQGPTTTVNWRSAPVSRPEQTLMGIQFTSQVNWGNNVPYVVLNSTNWVYASSGFKNGDSVPGIVGYEMDRYQATYPSANSTGTTFTLLSQSPYIVGAGSQGLPLISGAGPPDYANSSVYQAPSTAWVFASGTMSWSWGLDNFTSTYADARIQQTTANILNQFTGGPPLAPATNTPTATTTSTTATPSMTTALTNSRIAYGLGIFP